jgi:tetratricopeptide (TPR) repeat protein
MIKDNTDLNILKKIISFKGEFKFIITYSSTLEQLNYVKGLISEEIGMPVKVIDCKKINYRSLINIIFISEGVIILNNFQDLLKNDNLSVGFNQRRDRIVNQRIKIIASFTGPTIDTDIQLLPQSLMDWWSVRAGILDFRELVVKSVYKNCKGAIEEPKLKSICDLEIAEEEGKHQLLFDSLKDTGAWLSTCTKQEIGIRYYLLAQAEYFISLYDDSLIHYALAESVFKNLNNTKWIAKVTLRRGVLLHFTGRKSSALLELKIAKKIYEANNDLKGIGDSSYFLGELQFWDSNYEESELYYHSALESYKAIRDETGIVNVLYGFGELEYRADKFGKSLKSFSECRDIHTREHNVQGIAYSSMSIGMVLIKIGNLEDSKIELEFALKYFENSGDILGQTSTLYYLGMVQYRKMNYEVASILWKKVLSKYYEQDYYWGISQTLISLSLAEFKSDLISKDVALDKMNDAELLIEEHDYDYLKSELIEKRNEIYRN